MILTLAFMFLNNIKSGENFQIQFIPQELKSELTRLGICEGENFNCIVKIPKGPAVILRDLQEIAIGEEFCKRIEIFNKGH